MGPFSGAKAVTSSTLDASGMWRIEILPVSSVFFFTVEFRYDSRSVAKYAGLASLNRIFTIYAGSRKTYNMSINLSTPNVNDLTITAYGPFPSLSYNGGTPIPAIITSPYDAEISISSSGSEYYYLTVGVA